MSRLIYKESGELKFLIFGFVESFLHALGNIMSALTHGVIIHHRRSPKSYSVDAYIKVRENSFKKIQWEQVYSLKWLN